MKRLLFVILTAVALSVQAQPSTDPNVPGNPPPPTGFNDLLHTVFGYFLYANTNYDPTFGQQRFDLWTGVSSIQGGITPLVNDLGVSYDVWRPMGVVTNGATQTALALESDLRNGGIAGTVVSEQGGLSFSVITHDMKISAYADGGYLMGTNNASSKLSDRLYGEVGLRIKKAFGLHFYSGVGIGAQFPKNSQVFSGFAGLTF